MDKINWPKIAQVFFFSVLFLGLILLRFYKLGYLPQGITQDEAYYLYDAYSINQTGKDLWGKSHPLIFRSTGEYKLNLTYLIAGAIDVVGLSPIAARLPSAIAGLMTLLVVMSIVYRLTNKYQFSLLSLLILAFSPWHFGISRLFYESNVALFFLALALLSGVNILLAPHTSLKWWLLLGFSTSLTAYLYGPFRYLGLFMFALVAILSYKRSHHLPKDIFIAGFIYILVMLPISAHFFSSAGLMRLSQTAKLQRIDSELTINENRSNCYLSTNKNPVLTKICYLYWNKPTVALTQTMRTTLRLLSPEYLFYTNHDSYIIPKGYSAYLSYLLPFYLLGLINIVIALSRGSSAQAYLFYSMLGSILLTASAFELVYHRNVVGLLISVIIITLGIHDFVTWLYHKRFSPILRFVALSFLITLALFQTSKYLLTYYVDTSIKQPLLTKYDAPAVYDFLSAYRDYTIYDNIFFAPVYAGIYWGLDPSDFQQNAKWSRPDDWGFTNAESWHNLHFKGADLLSLLCLKHKNPQVPLKTLLVDDATGHYQEYASYISHDFTGSLDLHAVYDLDLIYPIAKQYYPGDLCRL